MHRADRLSDRQVLVGGNTVDPVGVNDWTMFHALNALRDFFAPTKYGAALWAVGYLLLVAAWCLWCSRLLGRLVDRIRTQDSALWQQLGSPQSWDTIGTVRNWSTLRRLRVDQRFAQQFDQRVVQEIRGLQQTITVGLVVLAVAGLLVMYFIWPHR